MEKLLIRSTSYRSYPAKHVQIMQIIQIPPRQICAKDVDHTCATQANMSVRARSYRSQTENIKRYRSRRSYRSRIYPTRAIDRFPKWDPICPRCTLPLPLKHGRNHRTSKYFLALVKPNREKTGLRQGAFSGPPSPAGRVVKSWLRRDQHPGRAQAPGCKIGQESSSWLEPPVP